MSQLDREPDVSIIYIDKTKDYTKFLNSFLSDCVFFDMSYWKYTDPLIQPTITPATLKGQTSLFKRYGT